MYPLSLNFIYDRRWVEIPVFTPLIQYIINCKYFCKILLQNHTNSGYILKGVVAGLPRLKKYVLGHKNLHWRIKRGAENHHLKSFCRAFVSLQTKLAPLCFRHQRPGRAQRANFTTGVGTPFFVISVLLVRLFLNSKKNVSVRIR